MASCLELPLAENGMTEMFYWLPLWLAFLMPSAPRLNFIYGAYLSIGNGLFEVYKSLNLFVLWKHYDYIAAIIGGLLP